MQQMRIESWLLVGAAGAGRWDCCQCVLLVMSLLGFWHYDCVHCTQAHSLAIILCFVSAV